jgi:hypothetical protein
MQALEAIDECGHLTGVKSSQLNKQRTLKEVREYELRLLNEQRASNVEKTIN